jgi:DNA gyrase/topoisomerase IV subunit B
MLNTDINYGAEDIKVLEGLEAVRKKARDVYWQYRI